MTKPETARQAYARVRHDIGTLLAKIKTGLAEHAKNAKADPSSWGYVGDLGSIKADLQNISDSLNREGEYAEADS